MPSTSELEQLSLLLAGELPPEHAASLRARLQSEPELQRAYERLQRLDQLTPMLAELEDVDAAGGDEALIAAAVKDAGRSGGARVSLLRIAAGVLLLLGLGAGTWYAMRSAPAHPPAEMRAEPSSPATQPEIASGSSEIATSEQASQSSSAASTGGASNDPASEIRIFGGPVAQGMVFWTPGTDVSRLPDDVVELRNGTLLVQAQGAVIRANDVRLTVRGEAVVSTEPQFAIAHVTRALTSHPKGADMQKRLDAFRSFKPAAFAGAALLVLALEGETTAAGPRGTEVVRQGQSWTKPAGAPGASEQQALTGSPTRPSEGPSTPASLLARPARVLEGAIDLPAVHTAVMGRSAELLRCFTSAQRRSPDVAGDVDVLLDIERVEGHGKVRNATIDESYSLNDPLVASCVVQELSRVQLPAPQGGSARIAYPLGFEPRGKGSGRGAMMVFPRDAISREGERIGTFMADREERVEVRAESSAPTLGPAGAPVTLVVFSSFDCSFCVKAWPVMRQLAAQYGDRLQIVYRHKPLPKPDHARVTSAAAIAAHQQGRFWEYGELLMAQPEARDRATLEAHAAKLGLDLLRFRNAMDGELAQKTLERDLAEGERLGVKGIPSFFVNGREIVGARPIDQYRAVIDEELAKAR